MQRSGESLGPRRLVARKRQSPRLASRGLPRSPPICSSSATTAKSLRSETLATTRLGGINLHGSLLPKYRGAAPVQWAILRGETETGNSVIQMTPGLDAGPCLGQQRTPIDPDEDAAALESRLATMGAELGSPRRRTTGGGHDATDRTRRLPSVEGTATHQRTWRNRLVPPAIEIKNLVRAVRPWPRAYTFWHRERCTASAD